MEIWATLVEFPDYEVSTHGRVKSKSRKTVRNGHKLSIEQRILKPSSGTKGHLYVNLRRGNKAHSRYVHRLVAEVFIGPPQEHRPMVAHGDGDPSNNHVSNIRWASAKENSQDSILHGTNKRPGGIGSGMAKLDISTLRYIHAEYPAKGVREIARIIGVSHSRISSVLKCHSYKDDLARAGLTPKM